MELLAERLRRQGDLISRAELSAFDVDGREIRLIDTSRGIRNPQWMDATLSILSDPEGPYGDEEIEGALLRYKYRTGGIGGDNLKLRAAVVHQAPMILLRKIRQSWFRPLFPVYAIADDPVRQEFVIALDESMTLIANPTNPTVDERRYGERIAKIRIHQPEFRGRVLVAYERQCSVCTLKHPELLDAAHIVPDGQPLGQPLVINGIALCKLHHAAYDQNLIGLDPDHRVHVNGELLLEVDGPMLKHGLQEMHGRTLQLPRRRPDRPDRERLALRFAEFRAAG